MLLMIDSFVGKRWPLKSSGEKELTVVLVEKDDLAEDNFRLI